MSNELLSRRHFAALGLGAFGAGLASPAFAGRVSRIKLPTTDTTTSTTTTPTTTLTTSSGSFCSLTLDRRGKDSFAGHIWNVQSHSKAYAILDAVGVPPPHQRFEVRNADCWSNDPPGLRNRAEFCCTTKQPFGRSIWFSYALKVVAGSPVSAWNVLGQFHNTPDSGDNSTPPPFAVELTPGDKLRFLRRFDAAARTTLQPAEHVMHALTIERDRWYRIVGRIVFGWQDNGAVELWLDGTKVVSLANTNIGYNDLVGPYWKYGIYRAEAPETLAVEYANLELGSTSLLGRVTSPLAI